MKLSARSVFGGLHLHLIFAPPHSPVCRPIFLLSSFVIPWSDEDTRTLRLFVIPSNANQHELIFHLYQAKSSPTDSLTRLLKVGEKVWNAFWVWLLVIPFCRSPTSSQSTLFEKLTLAFHRRVVRSLVLSCRILIGKSLTGFDSSAPVLLTRCLLRTRLQLLVKK